MRTASGSRPCPPWGTIMPTDGSGAVMLTAPLGVPGDAWPDVVARLAGAPLVREHTRAATGVPAPLESGDAVLRRFRADARRWTTATPVVMPRCSATPASPRRFRVDDVRSRAAPRRQRPRAPLPAPAPPRALPFSTPLGDVAHRPVAPLALGAGTGYGLGLLVPVPD